MKAELIQNTVTNFVSSIERRLNAVSRQLAKADAKLKLTTKTSFEDNNSKVITVSLTL